MENWSIPKDSKDITNMFSAFAPELVKSVMGNFGANCNVVDTPNVVYVYVELAGAENIRYEFSNNKLIVRAERTNPHPKQTSKQNEIEYGKLEKQIELPISVTKRKSVAHRICSGMLYLEIDKAEERKNTFSVNVDNNEQVN